MKVEVLVFLGSLLVAMACSAIVPEDSSCNCPTEATQPEAMGPFSNDFDVVFWGVDGEVEQGVVQPSSGNLEVTDSMVIINYVQESVTHHVEYNLFSN